MTPHHHKLTPGMYWASHGDDLFSLTESDIFLWSRVHCYDQPWSSIPGRYSRNNMVAWKLWLLYRVVWSWGTHKRTAEAGMLLGRGLLNTAEYIIVEIGGFARTPQKATKNSPNTTLTLLLPFFRGVKHVQHRLESLWPTSMYEAFFFLKDISTTYQSFHLIFFFWLIWGIWHKCVAVSCCHVFCLCKQSSLGAKGSHKL